MYEVVQVISIFFFIEILMYMFISCVCLCVCVSGPHSASSLPGGSSLWRWRRSGTVEPEDPSPARGASKTSQELG